MANRKRVLEKIPLNIKIKRSIWLVCFFFFFRPFGSPLFRLWRICVLKLFGARIEWDANIYASTQIWAPWNLKMGHRSCLGPHVICYNQDLVTLEDDVTVSQYAYLCTASHDIRMQNTAYASLITAPIYLQERSWIAARSYINLGVTVGADAIVGATASVYNDVEPNTIVGGNPAKFIKKRDKLY